MEDVKTNASENVGEITPEQASQPVEQTTEGQEGEVGQPTVTEEAAERQVPVSVLIKERKQRQELQRKLAELEGSQKLSKYDPADMEQVMAHPYVQELLIKQAKQELTDYARGVLEGYPSISAPVKKAILSNVRGFVKETTTDVENAKLDIQEYIEQNAQESVIAPVTPAPKNFQVASTNGTKSVPGTRPADVSKIMQKPIDEWTDKEAAIVDAYAKTKS